jgi:microcystin degradation protein MlrC
MISDLEKILPIDGCMAVAHGAAVSGSQPDMDGHWLTAVRHVLGERTPIVSTLDPHANVSPLMVSATNSMIAYATNPHVDQRETGRKAAEVLIGMLKGKIKPLQHLVQVPLAISIEQQNTSVMPCKGLYDMAGDLRTREGILSISILLGFPYADVEEMGTSFLVITDNNPMLAREAGEILKSAILTHKEKWVGIRQTMEFQLHRIKDLKKPVLLLDMGDNVGGGSPGDSAFLLACLERIASYQSFICIYDPEAVRRAADHQINEQFDLAFGNQDASPGGRPYYSLVRLISIADGKFRESNPRHGGQVNYDMGKTVIIRTEKGNTVMLHSLRVPPFSLSQLTTFGIHPESFDVIIAKGVNAPIAAYGPVCGSIVQINSPGVTQADMTAFTYTNRRRPMFPFEPV